MVGWIENIDEWLKIHRNKQMDGWTDKKKIESWLDRQKNGWMVRCIYKNG